MITSCSLWWTSCTVLYCTALYCTALYCTAVYCVVLQDQLLSNIAVDHHEEPGEVVALVSNPLQPDQVGTASLYWTEYTLAVSNITK